MVKKRKPLMPAPAAPVPKTAPEGGGTLMAGPGASMSARSSGGPGPPSPALLAARWVRRAGDDSQCVPLGHVYHPQGCVAAATVVPVPPPVPPSCGRAVRVTACPPLVAPDLCARTRPAIKRAPLPVSVRLRSLLPSAPPTPASVSESHFRARDFVSEAPPAPQTVCQPWLL